MALKVDLSGWNVRTAVAAGRRGPGATGSAQRWQGRRCGAVCRKDVDVSVPLVIEHQTEVIPCAEMLADDAAGCFGFHAWATCPDCQERDLGYVARSTGAAGTNGPQTGHADSLRELLPMLKRTLQATWKGRDGTRYGWVVLDRVCDVTFRGR